MCIRHSAWPICSACRDDGALGTHSNSHSRGTTMGIVFSKPEQRWPGRRIPFVIDDNDFPAGSPQRAMVTAAIATWNLQTFAPLVDRSNESDYVRFREADANLHSHVGRQGSEQGV